MYASGAAGEILLDR